MYLNGKSPVRVFHDVIDNIFRVRTRARLKVVMLSRYLIVPVFYIAVLVDYLYLVGIF